MIDLATRFYLRGQTQIEIARELGLDPSTVSRQLKRARDEGIVRVEIRRPAPVHVELGRELANRFRLRRAVVVADDEEGLAGLVRAAADYVSSQLANGMRVSLSWGRLLSAVVHALPAGAVSDLDISLLLGGVGRAGAGIQGHELARHLGSLHPRSRINYLHAPLLVDSLGIKQAMLRDGSIQAALQAAASSELALVGIGALDASAPLIRDGHLSDQDRALLLDAGAVGDICARFFTIDGRPVPVLDDRLIAIDWDDLAGIATIVAMAAGPEKHDAICGALRTGRVHVLVTDVATARALVAVESGSPRRPS